MWKWKKKKTKSLLWDSSQVTQKLQLEMFKLAKKNVMEKINRWMKEEYC